MTYPQGLFPCGYVEGASKKMLTDRTPRINLTADER